VPIPIRFTTLVAERDDTQASHESAPRPTTALLICYLRNIDLADFPAAEFVFDVPHEWVGDAESFTPSAWSNLSIVS
jgi:hypothetical protein